MTTWFIRSDKQNFFPSHRRRIPICRFLCEQGTISVRIVVERPVPRTSTCCAHIWTQFWSLARTYKFRYKHLAEQINSISVKRRREAVKVVSGSFLGANWSWKKASLHRTEYSVHISMSNCMFSTILSITVLRWSLISGWLRWPSARKPTSWSERSVGIGWRRFWRTTASHTT